MKFAHRLFLIAVTLGLTGASQVFAQQSLEEGADQAVRGTTSKTVNVGKHGFQIDAVKVQRTADGVRAEGFFRHVIKGKDDKVFYVIEVKKGEAPQVTMDRVEYNGLFGAGGKVKLGVNWVGKKAGGVPGVDEAVKALNVVLKGLNAIQRKLIGKWEPSAVKVLDAIAARLAQEA